MGSQDRNIYGKTKTDSYALNKARISFKTVLKLRSLEEEL